MEENVLARKISLLLALSLMHMVGYASANGNDINITDAEHLNIARQVIDNIFDDVNNTDNLWSPRIYHEQYVRVMFQRNISNQSIVNIVVRNVQDTNTSIEIYEKDGNVTIGTFGIIESNISEALFTRLHSLATLGDTFDFKIVNNQSNSTAYLEFNYFHDSGLNLFTPISGAFDNFNAGSNVNIPPAAQVRIQVEDNNNEWVLVGRSNAQGAGGTQNDLNASLNLTYDISTENFNVDTILELKFEINYCHSRVVTLPFRCKKLQNNVFYNGAKAQIYNFTSSSYQPMGDLTLSDGVETLEAFIINDSIAEFVVGNLVHIRYPVDITISQNGRNACLALDFAPLTVSFISNNVSRIVFVPQGVGRGDVPHVQMNASTRFYNNTVPYVLLGNVTRFR